MNFLCKTCGTQFADSGDSPPASCPICEDARQYVLESGQQWTTLEELRGKHEAEIRDEEPGLIGIGLEPEFAIGQRALLVESRAGNVLWDCTVLLEEHERFVHERGGLAAIAISHPHFFTTMVEWAHAFACPVLVHEADREWVMRPDPSVEFWSGETRGLWDGMTLLRLGGHFAGGQVLHTSDGKLLTGDVVATRPGGKWVSFMYSYPMLIPLPAAEVERIAAALEPWQFDRIYGGWWGSVVRADAKEIVRRSAQRYMRAVTVGLEVAHPRAGAPEPRVAGVDMAGGGWAVVVLEGTTIADAFRCETFAEALLVDAEVIAVDVPIGVPDDEPRAADAEARRFVGPRASSVFTTPIRSALDAATYAEARGVSTQLTGKSLSAQAYALRKRILEVDEYAQRDERVIEVHPEVSFRELARRPIPSKHRAEGLVERRRLLEEARIELPAAVPRIAEPDLLDATIAAWTAQRYARGDAVPLPAGHSERIGAIWR